MWSLSQSEDLLLLALLYQNEFNILRLSKLNALPQALKHAMMMFTIFYYYLWMKNEK